MNPRELLRNASESFRGAGVPDPEYDSALLLSHITGRPPLQLRIDTETELEDEVLERFQLLCQRRLRREPLQYILGESFFCGFAFHVDSRVLIPRPETELLCEWALESLSCIEHPRVLDLCCGSGCIGISLKLMMPSAHVWCSDISGDALKIAGENAIRLRADIDFVQSDLFSEFPGELFDMIVSNPPYIPSSDCFLLQPEVKMEPHDALDGGTDGLSFYRRICREAPLYLKHGGILRMELGDGESDSVASLMRTSGFSSIEIRNDYQSLPRMISGIVK